MAADGGDADATLAQFAKAGVDVHAVARQLQDEGAGVRRFVDGAAEVIADKRTALAETR